jgi:hypothetical protein
LRAGFSGLCQEPVWRLRRLWRRSQCRTCVGLVIQRVLPLESSGSVLPLIRSFHPAFLWSCMVY